jgi:hypothetical protein
MGPGPRVFPPAVSLIHTTFSPYIKPEYELLCVILVQGAFWLLPEWRVQLTSVVHACRVA